VNYKTAKLQPNPNKRADNLLSDNSQVISKSEGKWNFPYEFLFTNSIQRLSRFI